MNSNRSNPTFVVRRTGQDELQHWKYVKREKVNGKWKYYYNWDELKKDAKNALGVNAKQNMNAAKTYYKNAQNKSTDAYKKVVSTNKKYNNIPNKKSLAAWEANKKADKAMNAYRESITNAANRGREYLEAKNAYMKTPLGKLDQAKADIKSGYNKAKKSVSKFLSNLPGKAKNAVDKVKDASGITAKQNANAAKKKYDQAKDVYSRSKTKETLNYLSRSTADYAKARREYQQSPMGQLPGKAKAAAKSAASTVKSAANTAARTADKYADRAEARIKYEVRKRRKK